MIIGFYSDTSLPRADGIAISMEAYGQAFQSIGHSVELVAPDAEYTGSIPIRRLPSLKPPLRDYRVALILPRHVSHRTEATFYNVVHVHTLGPVGLAGLMAARKAEVPAVLTWHTDILSYRRYYPEVRLAALLVQRELRRLHPMSPHGISQYSYRNIILNIIAAFDAIIVPTPKVEHQLQELGCLGEINVVPSPTLPLPASALSTLGLRRRLGIDSNAITILFVGRLSGEKNQELLLKAFAAMRRVYRNCELVLVGARRDERSLHRQANRLGITRYLHMVGEVGREELSAYYAMSDIFVIPSFSETQSLVAQEAEAFGLPVIVVDRGLQSGFGRTRILSAPDAESLASTMVESVANGLNSVRPQKRNVAPGYMPLAINQAARLVEIYSRCLGKSP